ncbi:MAG: septum formation initiator family protein [Faecousia sp.]|nr:septum formation initiator family protein [Bacillota bacterium]MDY2719975.1 septum formation initiator family protein [Candidatus Faecousia sp.]
MKFKKTRLLTKLLLLAVAVYAVVTLVSLRTQILQKQKQAAALEQQVAAAQQEQLELQEDIDKIGTKEGVIKVARERLGMVEDGEIVFYDSDD